jgi:hypothetical protein
MRKIWSFSLPLLFFFSLTGKAQTIDSLKINFSGFIESYYAYDFNSPTESQKLPFMYNYNRHNEFAVNLALLKAKITYKNCYASIALQAGTYVMDNYANENVKYLNEAYVGTYLDQAKKHNIEIGILPSYIGFESAASLNNPTLTRSILADNSPLDNVAKSAAYYTVKKLRGKLANAVSTNEETKAHRAALLFSIDKVLKVD